MVLEHFSGTLCVDELHLGRFTSLLATDPLADLQAKVAAHRPAEVAALGPFWSGAVGYASYDLVRCYERLPDGNPDEMSESHLYFTNQAGDTVWELPYEMDGEWGKPMRFAPNGGKGERGNGGMALPLSGSPTLPFPPPLRPLRQDVQLCPLGP